MRKIFALPAIFISLIGMFSISSCNNAENPVVFNPERNIIWQSVDSIESESIDESFIIAENDAVFMNMQNSYRIQNGNRTQLNYNDTYFYPLKGDGFSSDYFVVAGATYGSRGVLKIFDHNALTTVMFDSTINSTPRDVRIISPGKIIIATAFKIYMYDNGSVSLTASISPSGSGIYLMIQALNNNFYFTANTSSFVQKVFKLAENSLSLVSEENASDAYMQSNNNFFRCSRILERRNLDVLSGDNWHFLSVDSSKRKMIYCAGAELEYQYFISQDSATGLISGKYRTPAGIYPDPNFPIVSQDASYTTISLMRDHAFYFTKYSMIKNKTYIYKSKLG
jgi:hypothetical protein